MTPNTLKAVRTLHNFSGVFLAPTILFFAITGGLQMFGLHETSKGSSYVPPALLTQLSQLHKKGTLYLPPKRSGPPAGAGAAKLEGGRAEGEKPVQAPASSGGVGIAPALVPKPPNPLPIKIFFAITSIGLVLSTLTGVVMAWKYARRKGVVVGTLVAGVVVPLLLLLV